MPMLPLAPSMAKKVHTYPPPGRSITTNVSAIIFLYICLHLNQNSFAIAFTTRHLQYKTPNINLAPRSLFTTLHDLRQSKDVPERHQLSYSNNNGNENIPEQKRIDAIRHIQRSFYQDEGPGAQPPERGGTLIHDLTLWRGRCAELPGYQNILNVNVPHYTNMFHKILNSKNVDQKYFGHIYLPDGSDNLDNDECSDSDNLQTKAKLSLTGVLMKISDYKQLDDGQLILVVQALERFRVVKTTRDFPYAIATVEIIPDQELVETFNFRANKEEVDDEDDRENHQELLPEAVGEAFQWHSFEARSVTIDECMIQSPDGKQAHPKGKQAIAISPLTNFNAYANGDISRSYNKDLRSKKNGSVYSQTSIKRVMDLEYAVWLQLDDLIRLLQHVMNKNKIMTKIPVPTQILGLLPQNPPYPWPSQFSLEDYASDMERGDKIVRVDNMEQYPHLRRAQRLSYVVWCLMDSITLNMEVAPRQTILEMHTIAERLKAANTKLTQIGDSIRGLN